MNAEDMVLPEFAFLDANYSGTDLLDRRSVVIHIPSGTIMEFIPEDEFGTDDPCLVKQQFIYRNIYGIDEPFVVFVHHCYTDEGRGSANRIRFEILHKAIQWFCEYMDWEDKAIFTEDTANIN